MARRVFFSFHYQHDIWRVNQIRNLTEVIGTAAAGFQDASMWEESKKKGDSVIRALIDKALENTSVTVVFIGSQTAGRKFITYEIDQSIKRGNGLVGIQIHHLKDRHGNVDEPGATPSRIAAGNYSVYKYADSEKLKNRIEEAARAAGR